MPHTEKRGDGEYPWRVKWALPGQRTATGKQAYDSASGFATHDDAYNYGLDMESDLRRGRYRDARRGEMHLGEWAAKVMEHSPHADTTLATRRGNLRRYILPRWADTPLAEINRWDVRTWAQRLPLAPSTVDGVVDLLSYMLTAAVEANLLDANPIYRLRLSTAGSRNVQNLEQAEERVWAYPEDACALAARCRRADGLMILTAAFTGMRWGELTGLHRDNCGLLRRDTLDGRTWLRRVIRIDPKRGSLKQVSAPGDDGREHTRHVIGAPKPPNGAREADLTEWLADLLAAHLADWPYEYVFTTPSGTWWWRGNWATAVMRPVCDGRPGRARGPRRREVAAWEALAPGLEMHGLRHGNKTAMEEDGIAQVLQDEQMGHGGGDGVSGRDRRPVQKRYTHITARMRRARLDALDARWERTKGLYLPAA